MKLTCVTAVMNAIKSGNRERLIRCVRSVAALKTPHEHLIYDGGSTDGTVELLRELERDVESRSRRADGEEESKSKVEERTCRGESGALIERALPRNENSATSHSLLFTSHSTLRIVSEPDTGIYNALNKGVRDAKGEWFYVLGCDDYIFAPHVLDSLIAHLPNTTQVSVSPVKKEFSDGVRDIGFVRRNLFFGMPYCHQGVLIRTDVVRSLGGFDERYRISADYDMILKCHRKALNIRFYRKRYAVFSASGISGQVSGLFGEALGIMREQFSLSITKEEFEERRALPLKVVFPYLFHRDDTLRWVSLSMIARWGLWIMKSKLKKRV